MDVGSIGCIDANSAHDNAKKNNTKQKKNSIKDKAQV